MTEENSFHATVSCTKARALREKMRDYWDLPPEKMFQYTGKDWLLILLDCCSKNQRAQVLLVLWRAWHIRCDAIYEKGKETIKNSVNLLLAYASALVDHVPVQRDDKGKTPVHQICTPTTVSCSYSPFGDICRNPSSWVPPKEGTVKINVDAAFCPKSGASSIGAVARNSQGIVIAAVSKPIGTCQDVVDAEAEAILAGLRLGLELQVQSLVLESDSQVAVGAATNKTLNKSRQWSTFKDIEEAKCGISVCLMSFTRRLK
jgi:hypothetical protein